MVELVGGGSDINRAYRIFFFVENLGKEASTSTDCCSHGYIKKISSLNCLV